jgi:hypothetical protein
VAFSFSSLQIKLFWPLLLESTSDLYPSRPTDPCHHLSFPAPHILLEKWEIPKIFIHNKYLLNILMVYISNKTKIFT